MAAMLGVLLAAPAAGQEAYRLPLVEQAPLAGPVEARAAAVLVDSTIIYDDDQPALTLTEGEARLEVYELGPGSRQANRFVKASGDSLLRVAMAPYYRSDFSGTGIPPDAPRDFFLTFWADDDGTPGDSLAAFYIDDPRANLATSYTFLEISLDSLAGAYAALLPHDAFYVGLTDAGDDENYLLMGVSEYLNFDEAIVSFLSLAEFCEGQGCWRPFNQIFSQITGDSLYNRVLPIRATIATTPPDPVAVEEPGTPPAQPTLFANYPNPFNPRTTIRYALPEGGAVRLAVYDLLGREVARLVEGVQGAGTYRVAVDARAWPSGVYLYTLEAAGHRQTRRMILIK